MPQTPLRRLLARALAAALSLSVSTSATVAIAAPPVRPSQARLGASIGVQVQPWYVDGQDLGRIAAAGIGTLRWGISWQAIEQGAGSYDWSQVDAFVQRLRQTSLKSVVIIGFGNAIYSGTLPTPDGGSYPAPPSTPAAQDAYARFAAAAAARYAGDGFKWEIWNEPDSAAFWAPAPDPAAYASLAAKACSAMKSAAPGTFVIGGVGAALPDAWMWDANNIYAALANSGAAGCLDAISGHAYRMDANYNEPSPDSVAQNVRDSRSYLYNSLGIASAKPFYIGEWGWPTSLVAPNLQLAYLMRGMVTGVANGSGMVIGYEWRDSRDPSAGHEARFGLYPWSGSAPKASPEVWNAFTWLANATLVGPLQTGRSDAFAMQVSSGGKLYALVWLDTDNIGRQAQLYIDGRAIGLTDYLPRAYPIKSANVTISIQG
jgi:hypothetical protein